MVRSLQKQQRGNDNNSKKCLTIVLLCMQLKQSDYLVFDHANDKCFNMNESCLVNFLLNDSR